MAFDICLHPDLIEEVMEDLFATDAISQDQLRKLKNDFTPVDPNLVMDVRHKEIKKESLVDLAIERKTPELFKRKTENLSNGPSSNVKDLKTIDKEILKAKKCLEKFHNKLEKTNKTLTMSVLDLEKEQEYMIVEEKIEEEGRDSPAVFKLNEQETAHYFNLHLDRLEHAMNQNHKKDNIKTWRPIEPKSPIINVITTFRDFNISSASLSIEDELRILEKCNENLFQITGQTVTTSPETQAEQSNNLVPNNSPTYNVSVIIDDKNQLTLEQKKIVQKVVKTWKLFVKSKKILRWSEKRKDRLKTYLYGKYFSLWIAHTKQCKDAKVSPHTTPLDTLEIIPSKCTINPKKFAHQSSDFHSNVGSEIIPEKNINSVDKFQVLVHSESQTIKKIQVEITPNKVFIPDNGKRRKNATNGHGNSLDKTEVHVKTLTPQEVGLVQQKKSDVNLVCTKNLQKQMHEVKGNITSRSFGEPLLHRFEAQEKIIKQQRDVIEKQNRIIFDLQAKCLEIESKLNWSLAERQLSDAESKISKVSAHPDTIRTRKTESKCIIQEGPMKPQDKSDIIVKNMLERQAYCSHLAEKTKLRKKRLDEERERKKLEEEEKQKQEKEEERKKRVLQIKMEQQIALEKQNNILALRKKEAELLEKATQHYKKTLLRRSFARLKKISFHVLVKSEDCDRVYRQKLMGRVFNEWRKNVRQNIQLKYQFAENYYHEKLLRLAWDELCKVHQDYKIRLQVSDDLYSLKLQERMFRRWQAFAAQQFLENACKIELAERLYRRRLMRRYFHQWREFPKLMFKEREVEQRRRAWRNSIQQLIPDFTPAYVDET